VNKVLLLILLFMGTATAVHAQDSNSSNLYNAGGFGTPSFKQPDLSGKMLKEFSDHDDTDSMPPLSNKPNALQKPLFGRATKDYRLTKIHQSLKLTDSEVIQEPDLEDFMKPALRRDEIDRRVVDSNRKDQYDYNRDDLSRSLHGDGHFNISRPYYASSSGDWFPSPIDFILNGGFGLQSPNGIVDLPPQNGRVEKTFYRSAPTDTYRSANTMP
jgi:hypothetical protein